jgi:hypothetical protein
MADGMTTDWRELCLAVTHEQDSTKLSSLVRELIEALDKGLRHSRFPNSPTEKNSALSDFLHQMKEQNAKVVGASSCKKRTRAPDTCGCD